MNALFQLNHTNASRHGSFWGSQVDLKTTGMLRDLARTSSVPSRLQHLDVVGAYAMGAGKILKEGITIGFTDGHFAMTGPDMFAYVPIGTETITYERSNDDDAIGASGAAPRLHRMAEIASADLAALTADVPTLLTGGSWFLLPKPAEINPVIIESARPGVTLVYGIDFFTSKNFIITQLPPADHFTYGKIVVRLAEVSLEVFDAYQSDSPRARRGRKWVNTYAKRSQSMELFRRAAAEFCGLYVLPDPDVVLNVIAIPDGSYVYAFASAGVVTVDYAHTPLTAGTSLPAGYVLCDTFTIRSAAADGAGFLTSTTTDVDLSGLFGVPLWLPADGMVDLSYQFTDANFKPHLRAYYGGSPADLELTWASQAMHERRNGLFLADELGYDSDTAYPVSLDAGALLENFYGSRLHLLEVSGLPDASRFELRRFLKEHAPLGVVILLADHDVAGIAPTAAAAPPEGQIVYAGLPLYYAVDVLSYD